MTISPSLNAGIYITILKPLFPYSGHYITVNILSIFTCINFQWSCIEVTNKKWGNQSPWSVSHRSCAAALSIEFVPLCVVCMVDKICHPEPPSEEFVAPAARNAAGRMSSAGSTCKDCLSCKACPPPLPPRGSLCPAIDGARVKRLGHFVRDGPTLIIHIRSRGYGQADIAAWLFPTLNPAPHPSQILIPGTLHNKYLMS